MNTDYWHKRWQENHIGFHQPDVHPMLASHYSALNLPKRPRIFVPLCGKSLDIGWLLAQGAHVIACELSPLAINQLLAQLNCPTDVHHLNARLTHHRGTSLDIFIGDYFDLTPANLGHIDAVYDRAALVALPPEQRIHYSAHLCHLSQNAPQLLIGFTYEQSLMQGPPFSVPSSEIQQHYRDHYTIQTLQRLTITNFKNTCPATEDTYLLTPKALQGNAD